MKITIDLDEFLNEVRQVIKEELSILRNSLSTDLLEEPITQKQLSEFLGVSVQTLIRWRQKGKIPFIEVGSAIRYDKSKVIKALEKK